MNIKSKKALNCGFLRTVFSCSQIANPGCAGWNICIFTNTDTSEHVLR